jgi:glycosyltransferase involved in cell wall biosynthesis
VRTWEEPGGIGVYTRSIVPNLLAIDRKNEYILFSQNSALKGRFPQYENVREIYIPSKNKLIWDQVTMPWYAQKEGVDVIFHTKFSIPLLSPKKTVMVLHGTERFFYSDFHPKTDRVFFRTIYPQYLKRASAILAVSERARHDIIDKLYINPGKIKTVHLAVDPIFRVIKDEAFLNNIRKFYHLPKEFIIYVGHIYPGKNLGRLFQAFARVRKEHDVILVIAGSKRWKFEEDLNLIKKLGIEGHVQLLGHVRHEHLVGLYNLAKMTAFPSYYESFPAIPLEANACGCPVVTSNTGGTPESAGNAAVYVNPLDVGEIADGMLRVLTDEDLRKDLIQKGFKNVQRFSWQKTARKTLKVLKSLV